MLLSYQSQSFIMNYTILPKKNDIRFILYYAKVFPNVISSLGCIGHPLKLQEKFNAVITEMVTLQIRAYKLVSKRLGSNLALITLELWDHVEKYLDYDRVQNKDLLVSMSVSHPPTAKHKK